MSATTVKHAIEVERLSKHFTLPRPLGQLLRHPWKEGREQAQQRLVVAVDDVSFQVQPGELFGLLGPNGAGKTTLIKLLCTLIVPSSGRAAISGFDLAQAERVREVVGMATGDERSFYFRLSGRQNLEFFAALYGMHGPPAARRIQELLERVELAGEADRPFRTYSSGQKQRLSIARSLLHRPKVLFLDEPTRSLDPSATITLHEFIEQELLAREGMTIFLTTHRLDEAQRLCRRIAIMDRGKLRACGTPEELRSSLGQTALYRLRVHGLAGPAGLRVGLPGRLDFRWLNAGGNAELLLRAGDGEAALSLLLERIIQAGGRVLEVVQERPTLEEVFQRFTQSASEAAQDES